MTAEPPANLRPLIASGVLLGIGMGGFVDGILFHQILKLHQGFYSFLVTLSVT